MKLPDDCHLAYVVSHEAWYASVIKGREINISAASSGGGVAWEFRIEEADLGTTTPCLRAVMFDDAFQAFREVPELFEALATLRHPSRLGDLVGVLQGLGAVDETERKAPAGMSETVTRGLPRGVREGMVALGWTPPEATDG